MKDWLNRLLKIAAHNAGTRKGMLTLFIFAFADASFLPTPVTTLFVLFSVLDSKKAYRFAVITLSGTFAGCIAGYFLGHFLWLTSNGEFTQLAKFFFAVFPGFTEKMYFQIQSIYLNNNFWVLLFSAVTPIPLNLFSVLSGAFNLNILLYLATLLLSQGLKFFILALATRKLGNRIMKITEFSWKPVAALASRAILTVFVFINSLL